MDPKSFLASKTVWFNLALVTLGLIEYLNGHQEVVQVFVKPEYFGIAVSTIGLIGIILRSVTSQPLGESGPSKR